MENIDLQELQQTREKAIRLQDDISELNKQKESLVLGLEQIQQKCSHRLAVKLQSYDFDDNWNEAYCLNCNQRFHGPFLNFDKQFQNLIHFEHLTFDGEQPIDEIKVEVALEMFRQEREKYPELSDAEIVALINEQIKYQTASVEEQGFVKSKGTKNQQ